MIRPFALSNGCALTAPQKQVANISNKDLLMHVRDPDALRGCSLKKVIMVMLMDGDRRGRRSLANLHPEDRKHARLSHKILNYNVLHYIIIRLKKF
jgi:hypothetical protein